MISVLADIPLNPEIIFILIALIASAVKTFFDRRNAAEMEEDEDDPYELHREEIVRRQRGEAKPEIWSQLESMLVESRQPTRPTPPPIPQREITPPPPQSVPFQPPKVVVPKLSAAEQSALANFQKNNAAFPRRTHRRHPKTGLRAALANNESTRQAIILSEILGKPKGLL